MSTPGVPQWGCPWHGLVKGTRLALSNGEQLFYPQPNPDSMWEAGSTALIQHPLAPEIVRSPEEAAADALAGRQWWNKAILSGGSLHGHALGGWIYIDDDGASWLVKTTLSDQIEGGPCDVTLKRFGVLGGKAEEYTYTVTVPDMGQATPTLEGTDGYLRVTLYHTNKTGSAAAYEVACRMTDESLEYWRWRPCGWVELTLSGPGSECVAEFTTLKTRSQTLGAAQEVPMVLTPDLWYAEEITGIGNRLVRTPSGETTAVLLISHYSGTTSKSSGYEAYVVGIFYDDTGRHEITLSEQAETLIDSPVAKHSGDTEFGFNVPITGTWTATLSLISTLTLTYSIDGTAVCTYNYSFESANETTAVIDDYTSTTTTSESLRYTPGATFGRDSSYTGGFPTDVGFNLDVRLSAAHRPELIPNRIGGGGRTREWVSGGGLNGLTIAPHRHSNTLFGICNWLTGELGVNAETHYLADLATPAGKVTLSEFQGGLNPASTFCYGSWCPVTGQAVRAIVPVCWV